MKRATLSQAFGGVKALGDDLQSERSRIPVRRYRLRSRPSDWWLSFMRDSLTEAVGYDGKVFMGSGYLEAFLDEDADADMALVYELRWRRGR